MELILKAYGDPGFTAWIAAFAAMTRWQASNRGWRPRYKGWVNL